MTWIYAWLGQLLQAKTKDNLLIEVINEGVGHNKTIATVLYYLISFASGGMTPGEEFAGIKPISSGDRFTEILKRILYVIGIIIGYKIELFESLRMRQLCIIAKSVSWILFLLDRRYLELSKRVLGISYVSLIEHENEASLWEDVLLVTVILINSYFEFRSLPPDRKPVVRLDSRCPLCIDNISEPSKCLCGHLFCWSCIITWLEHQPWCPLCRRPCLPQQVAAVPPVDNPAKKARKPIELT